MRSLYQAIAETLETIIRIDRDNGRNALWTEWRPQHKARLDWLVSYLPAGSGFDDATHLRLKDQKPNQIVLATSFHHIDEFGSYDGWTDHVVTVKPSLVHGFDLHVSGRNVREIKDYLHEIFEEALRQKGDWIMPEDYAPGSSHHGVLVHD